MVINEVEQVKELSVRQLETDEVFNGISALVESFREPAAYYSEAAQLRRILEEKLSSQDASEEARKKYAGVSLLCKFFGLLNLGAEGRAELVKSSIIQALTNEIKVRELLEDYLINSFDATANNPERPNLLKAIKENQETLAGKLLKDWLQSYRASAKSVGSKRDAIERLNFINFDIKVKSLAPAEKNILLKALELFDWLEFPEEEKLQANVDVIVDMADGSTRYMKMSEFEDLKKKGLWRPPRTTGNLVVQSKSSAPALTQVKQTPPPARPVSASTKSTPKPAVPASVPTRPSPAPTKPALQPIFIPTIERYDAAAEKLIKESGLNVAPELQQRFKMIVVSRLKEVRKWVETRQKLMSPLASGGMGFAYEQAEKFLKLVDEKKEGLLKEMPVPLPMRDFSPLAQNYKKVDAPLPSSAPVIPPALIRDSSASSQNDKKSGIASVAPPPPVGGRQEAHQNDKRVNDVQKTSSDIVKAPPQPLKIVQQEKAAPKIELAPLPTAQIKPAPKIVIPQTPAGRSKMEDVAYKPRLVGPVEELREMTLVDFRRLSPQAKVTADKIYAKIELLAEESYEKKIAGIKAWQESEVNKMYLGLLNESVDAAKPVQKVIEERQGAGRPSLTYEEFKTVMELNRRLRN